MVSFLILVLSLVLVLLPLWSAFKLLAVSRKNEELERRLRSLEGELYALRETLRPAAPTPRVEAAPPAAVPLVVPPAPVQQVSPTVAPPVIAAPITPPVASAPLVPQPVPAATPQRNWEQFTGAKLLAWAGGFAAFLGAAFFIKYSFEHDLVPPALRVALGYLFGFGLIAAGLMIPRVRYATTAQTLCATGIVCLYAVTFACNSIYQFFAAGPTFLVMLLITAGAFFLALRLRAQVVAVLGLVGGFVTPVLLSTGRDNPLGLFSYIALLDVGLVAMALRQNWLFLVPLGAAGTIAMQIGWAGKFLNAFKSTTAMVICLVFCALFLGAYLIARVVRRPAPTPPHFTWSLVALVGVSFVFTALLVSFSPVAQAPQPLLGFMFAASLSLFVLSWYEHDDVLEPHTGLTLLSVLAAVVPNVVLAQLVLNLPAPPALPVFGFAFLLAVLSFAVARGRSLVWLPAVALVGALLVQYAWQLRHHSPIAPGQALPWHVAFYTAFAAFPFLFRRHFQSTVGPWAVAALSGVGHFYLVYDLVLRRWPNDAMGLLPLAFATVPAASLLALHRSPPTDERTRVAQFAWFGGVALFFVTLAIPVQFERQWITLGWALEAAALLWLFHRVPHPGLRATGIVLLVAAFVRLALNPAVLEYQVRSGAPVFNWYLYAYGIVIVCLFVGARLLAPPRERALGVDAPPLLNTLGVILAFVLLNIEIADVFTPPGARFLTLEFSGNFARDMTYTIAWALFALGLLLVSIWRQVRAGRYAALGLLGVALAKLFLHDLERLGALHRIGALFAVALIAILASVAYQRFLPTTEREPPREP